MKSLINHLLLLFILFFNNSVVSQITNNEIVGKLRIETADNTSKIIGLASNTTEVYYNVRYILSVIKPVPNSKETTKESQEGRIILGPSETKELSNTSVTIDENERVIILLLIYDEDAKLIAKDRYVFNDIEQEKTKTVQNTLQNDGIEFFGIVADETKTKLGKDFYDYFYFQYTYNKIEGKKVVTVQEIVSFGRNTRIQVLIDEEVIMEFYSKPNDEFLEEMSKTAIQRVYRYFENLKKENTYITQY